MFSGMKGQLHEAYKSTLAYWFQFGLELSVPAVRKHVVHLESRHSLPVTLRELQTLIHSHAIDTSARTFGRYSRQPFIEITDDDRDELLLEKIHETGSAEWLSRTEDDNSVFKPCDPNKDDQGMYVKSVVVARNFSQWKASHSFEIESEELLPKGFIILFYQLYR